jgi:hypothetical protein
MTETSTTQSKTGAPSPSGDPTQTPLVIRIPGDSTPPPEAAQPNEVTLDDPQLPTRLVGQLMAQHKRLLGLLRDQNATVVASFSKNIDQAIAVIDSATSLLRDEAVQSRTALGHLEGATRELRQETLRCERLLEEGQQRLETTQKALADTLALLHGILRPMVWLSLGALLSLILAAGYMGWRQLHAPSSTAAAPSSPRSPQPSDRPSGPSPTSPPKR